MCTVTYIPTNAGYILTSSRDEKVMRSPAGIPKIFTFPEYSLLYPEDGLHKGTWIAVSNNGRSLVLLNGGLVKHISKPPYKKSRGLVLLDAFKYQDAQDFLFRYDLVDIEPFTLIFCEKNYLQEVRWDGNRTYIKRLAPEKCHIWSSVTLYPPEIIEKRLAWFKTWQASGVNHELHTIRDFHHFGGEGDKENDILMQRNEELKTISITSIEASDNRVEMIYQDLQTGTNFTKRLHASNYLRDVQV